jgi:poly-beta-1,6-N-acetyl-D-glucosamine synthase
MIFFILVFIFYTLFISISIIGSLINIDSSHTIKDFNSSNDKLLTIIVPFRNEEIRINTLLSSFENQYNYKCIDQIIFVDDHSSDKSFEIIKNWTFNKNFNFKILSLSSDFGKKKAIDLGINNSNSEYIMTIDADVSFNYLFFSELKDKLASNSDLYLTSVIENNGLFISKISSFVISIISIGMANLKSPILVNGAGLIFRKSIYDKLQPFSSNFHISSGDDMFLLKSFIKNGNSVNTISGNSLTILTEGPSSFKSFLLRSLRWSGKMKKSGILISNLLGLLIVFCNLSLFPLAFFVWRYSNNIALFLILFKLTMDTSILLIASIRYKDYSQLKYLFLMFFIYPFVLALVTILNIINYDSNWKGRKVNSA